MLDFNKLAKKLPQISKHLNDQTSIYNQRIERAKYYFHLGLDRQQEINKTREVWHNKLFFNTPILSEDLSTVKPISPAPTAYTIIATDGSQISPSHHEIAYCYLINVGRVMIHYGQNLHPRLDSIPEVFYQTQDLYLPRQWGIGIEEWLGHKRSLAESVVLSELGYDWVNPPFNFAEEEPLDVKESPVPILAMVDGSLVHWSMEKLPQEAKDEILPPILNSWDKLKKVKIPLVGYISSSRSIENLNWLRLLSCPHPQPECSSYCADIDRYPCQVFEGVRDSTLWSEILPINHRSCLWKSNARIIDTYGKEQQIYFCYINVGNEIARVEIPAWVCEDPKLLDQSLSLIISQVQKGYGYPIVLSEAHNQAVIRSSDRASFFALLEQELVKAGIKNVGTSFKEARKRGSIA
jgi:hypothetical protein